MEYIQARKTNKNILTLEVKRHILVLSQYLKTTSSDGEGWFRESTPARVRVIWVSVWRYILLKRVKAPLPPSHDPLPAHDTLGCEGPPTCKRWKHPSTSQWQPPRTLHSHPKDHAVNTGSRKKETYSTLIGWFCVTITESSYCPIKTTGRMLTCIVSFIFQSQTTLKIKQLKLRCACWSMLHSRHRSKQRLAVHAGMLHRA